MRVMPAVRCSMAGMGGRTPAPCPPRPACWAASGERESTMVSAMEVRDIWMPLQGNIVVAGVVVGRGDWSRAGEGGSGNRSVTVAARSAKGGGSQCSRRVAGRGAAWLLAAVCLRLVAGCLKFFFEKGLPVFYKEGGGGLGGVFPAGQKPFFFSGGWAGGNFP